MQWKTMVMCKCWRVKTCANNRMVANVLLLAQRVHLG